MIEILVCETSIEIERVPYYLESENQIVDALIALLDKAYYSGESLKLYKVISDEEKEFVKDW